jgi:hypothetical protein
MSDTCRATRIPICSRISTRIAVSFGAHRPERGPFLRDRGRSAIRVRFSRANELVIRRHYFAE